MKGLIAPYTNIYLNYTLMFLLRICALYFLVITTWESFQVDGLSTLPYCTTWGHFLTTLLYVLIVLHNLFNVGPGSWFSDLTGIVLHLAAAMEFLIFVFFWAVLSYNDFELIFSYEKESIRKYYFFSSVVKHLLNPLLVWTVVVMNRTELKASNFYFSALLSVAYMLSNLLVTKSTGVPIYSVLDWSSMTSHIYSAVALGIYFAGHFVALVISDGISAQFGIVKGRNAGDKAHPNSKIKDF